MWIAAAIGGLIVGSAIGARYSILALAAATVVTDGYLLAFGMITACSVTTLTVALLANTISLQAGFFASMFFGSEPRESEQVQLWTLTRRSGTFTNCEHTGANGQRGKKAQMSA